VINAVSQGAQRVDQELKARPSGSWHDGVCVLDLRDQPVDVGWPLRGHDAVFTKMTTERIDQLGPLTN